MFHNFRGPQNCLLRPKWRKQKEWKSACNEVNTVLNAEHIMRRECTTVM